MCTAEKEGPRRWRRRRRGRRRRSSEGRIKTCVYTAAHAHTQVYPPPPPQKAVFILRFNVETRLFSAFVDCVLCCVVASLRLLSSPAGNPGRPGAEDGRRHPAGQHQGHGQHPEQGLKGHQEDLEEGTQCAHARTHAHAHARTRARAHTHSFVPHTCLCCCCTITFTIRAFAI